MRRGVISVTANVAARAMHEMCAAALAGRHDEAAGINEQLMPLHQALFVEANPIPVKWAVAPLGLIGTGHPPAAHAAVRATARPDVRRRDARGRGIALA